MLYSIVTWIITGLIAGLFVSFIFPRTRKYATGTIGAGIIGAFVGGVLYSGLKIGRISTQLDPTSVVIAFLGSLVLVVLVLILIKNDYGIKNEN